MLALRLLSLQRVITVYRIDMIPIREMAMKCTSKLYRAIQWRSLHISQSGCTQQGPMESMRKDTGHQNLLGGTGHPRKQWDGKEHHWGQDTGKALDLDVIGAAKWSSSNVRQLSSDVSTEAGTQEFFISAPRSSLLSGPGVYREGQKVAFELKENPNSQAPEPDATEASDFFFFAHPCSSTTCQMILHVWIHVCRNSIEKNTSIIKYHRFLILIICYVYKMVICF